MADKRDARNGGSLSTAALSKFEHLWTSRAQQHWVAWYTVYGNCNEIVYEKFDLGFDLLRGSYVDGDLLRGVNFEPSPAKSMIRHGSKI